MSRYRFECIDKITGRSMKLTAEGLGSDDAASKIWTIGFITSNPEECPFKLDPTMEYKVDQEMWDSLQTKQADRRLIGKVYNAWMSQTDLGLMLSSLDTDSHLYDRHWLLSILALETFSQRKENSVCNEVREQICWQWVVERKELALASLKFEEQRIIDYWGYDLPKPSSIERLRIELAGEGEYERAAQVCDLIKTIPCRVEDAEWYGGQAEKYRAK